MAAIPIFGRNGEAIIGWNTDARHILETGTGGAPNFASDGRVFELLHLVVENSHGSSQARFTLWDANEGSELASTAQVGGHLLVDAGTVLEKTWERGQGPRFRTNIVATTSGFGAGGSGQGTVAARAVFASGLLH